MKIKIWGRLVGRISNCILSLYIQDVNVDEYSDVDILEANSPAPSPRNPFHSYAGSSGPPTPSFVQPTTDYSQPMDYESPVARYCSID